MPAQAPAYPDHVTLNGIDAAVATWGYRFGERLDGGPWREVVYQVAFDDAANFIDSLMGLVRPRGTHGGGATRTWPHQFPNNEILFCVDAQGEPAGVPRPGLYLLSSDLCHVTARYEVPRFDIASLRGDQTPDPSQGPIPYSEWSVRSRTRNVAIAKAAVKKADGNQPEKDPVRRVHQEEMRLTLYQVPYLDPAPYRAVAKKVNTATMLGWGRGQVLFDDYDMEQETSTDGTITRRVTLTFLAQDHDWNSVPKDDDIGYDGLLGAASSNPFYEYVDLTGLLA